MKNLLFTVSLINSIWTVNSALAEQLSFVYGGPDSEMSQSKLVQNIEEIIKKVGAIEKLQDNQREELHQHLIGNMQNLLFNQFQSDGKGYIVPLVKNITPSPLIMSTMENRPFSLNPSFEVKGSELQALQNKTQVYYVFSVYPGEEGKKVLYRTLKGEGVQENEYELAFKAKSKIVVSEDYMIYFKNGMPASERAPFKIFSHAGVNAQYGKHQHDHLDFTTFVESEGTLKSPGKLKEDVFSRFMKKNLHFELAVMKKEEVEMPVLVALGGGAFSKSYQPKYSELVAEAYKTILESDEFSFKAVIFALPKFAPEDNLERYQRVFSKYTGKIPVILANSDAVEIAQRLSLEKHNAGIVNPADSWSIPGMYWNGGHVALEELLAMRTTVLLTQHPHLNPSRILDEKNYTSVAIPDYNSWSGEVPAAATPNVTTTTSVTADVTLSDVIAVDVTSIASGATDVKVAPKDTDSNCKAKGKNKDKGDACTIM